MCISKVIDSSKLYLNGFQIRKSVYEPFGTAYNCSRPEFKRLHKIGHNLLLAVVTVLSITLHIAYLHTTFCIRGLWE